MHVLIQAIINGILLGCIYAIAGVTFGIFYRVSKVFHIAFASIGILGTMLAVDLAGSHGGAAAVLAAIAIGLVAGAVATAAVYVLVYRPLVARGADAGTTFVASLGFALLLEALVALAFGSENRSFAVDSLTRQHDVLGYGLSALHATVVVLTVVIVGGLGWLLNRTRLGHQVRAVMSNPEQAELVGIRSALLSTAVCAVVGGLSVIAFVLQGLNSSVVISAGTPLTLFAVLAMICGGVESLWGTALAGIAIGVIGGISGTIVPGQWSATVVFVCALMVIVARPTGLVRSAVAT